MCWTPAFGWTRARYADRQQERPELAIIDGCSRAAAVKRHRQRPVIMLIVGPTLAAPTTRACSELEGCILLLCRAVSRQARLQQP